VSNDGVDVIWIDDMTIIQLKDKLKRCNLKTDIKTEPVKSLQTAIFLEDQKDGIRDDNNKHDRSRESYNESESQREDR